VTAHADLIRSYFEKHGDDDLMGDLRELLIDPDDLSVCNSPYAPELAVLVRALVDSDSPADRSELSETLLSVSLCPLHRVDYAICFEDGDEECAAIRAAFPLHSS
jgi:hypothetical protein